MSQYTTEYNHGYWTGANLYMKGGLSQDRKECNPRYVGVWLQIWKAAAKHRREATRDINKSGNQVMKECNRDMEKVLIDRILEWKGLNAFWWFLYLECKC